MFQSRLASILPSDSDYESLPVDQPSLLGMLCTSLELAVGVTLHVKRNVILCRGFFLPYYIRTGFIFQINIVHRDLKLGNMVLNKETNAVTITNFCLGKLLLNDDDLLRDQRGSPAYISPEVLSSEYDSVKG